MVQTESVAADATLEGRVPRPFCLCWIVVPPHVGPAQARQPAEMLRAHIGLPRLVDSVCAGIPVAYEQKRFVQPGFGSTKNGVPKTGLGDVRGVRPAGIRRPDVKHPDAKSGFSQFDVQPPGTVAGGRWASARAAQRTSRKDRNPVLVPGWSRGDDVNQVAFFQCCAQLVTWPLPELCERNDVGVVRRDFLDDSGKSGTSAVEDIPGKQAHRDSLQ